MLYLGKGTYGAVVSATNKEEGKGVAIKKLSKIEDIVSYFYLNSSFLYNFTLSSPPIYSLQFID